ncbi:hypothetical protein ACQEVZ_35460 [Dactylosporangium sp. CA-152071]|uniref:hypothetical protein n=1 Tax=Dactylosporangium sp. CA-152071 TaxID=3239933 RepID=UPI003D8BD610
MTPDLCGATARHAAASWASPRAAVTEVLAVWPPSGASRGPRSALCRSAISRRVIAHGAISRRVIAHGAISRRVIAHGAISRRVIARSAISRRVIAHRAIGVGLPARTVLRATFTEVLAT